MHIGLVCLLAILATGCAAPPRPEAQQAAGPRSASSSPAGPKRITAAITGNPTVLSFKLITAGGRSGVQDVEELIHAGLTTLDAVGTIQPRLAEAVPTVENGLWKLLPDGRMETTWTIRPGTQWHDGTPLTSADLLFTITVEQDKDLPVFGHTAYESLDRAEAPDARTIRVSWKRPYIEADTMFTRDLASPLPRHLLERMYLDDKASLLQSPYWNTEFVGTGPFKVQEYVRDSHVVLVANNSYILGRPKVDEVVVRFISDTRALVANILAGEVDLTMGRALSIDEAIPARDQWRDGKMDITLKSWILMHPQLLNPRPAAIAEVRFRQALLHAIDRQEMADSLQAGLVSVAHSFLNPHSPIHQQVEGSIVRYDYDPRRAMQMIEGLGYQRGADGFYRDGAGQTLSVEIMAGATIPINVKTMLAVADYWQRVGVGAEAMIVPEQRLRDREYGATRPGFETTTTSSDMRFPPRLHSREVPLPENSFRGSNNSRYASPELDALIEKYLVTIPTGERTDLIRAIIRHLTERVVPMGMFYDAQPTLLARRLANVAAPTGERSTIGWNAHEWGL